MSNGPQLTHLVRAAVERAV